MALTATVTKASVNYQQPGLWNLAIHLMARDGATDVIDKDYSVRFRTGDTIESKAHELIEMMQADIDQYTDEQVIYNNAELAQLAIDVKDGLDLS